MSATSARVVRVSVAERGGSGGPTQDRVFTTPNAVIVLDGASDPDSGSRNGGWLAEVLGNEIALRLTRTPGDDLVHVVEQSIRAVVGVYGLMPCRSPSTTVSIVRWTSDLVHALVLGDSPVVVQTTDAQLHTVRDDRLAQVGARRMNGFLPDHPDEWRQLVAAQRAARNRPGGYWIAEAVPDAAAHAVQRQWPRDGVAAVLVVTDGVSVGLDAYGIPEDWATAMFIANRDPRELLDLVHSAEESDPDGQRWPRAKRHDDKVAAISRFGT